jgi:hypothetical protein
MLNTGASETPSPAFCFGQILGFFPLNPFVAAYHKLSNSIASLNIEIFLTKVRKDDFNLATIIAVNRSGGV